MLIPDIKNCSDCGSLIETISSIDLEIYYLSELRRDNDRFDLSIYVDLDKLDKLIFYKRILQKKLRNPNYVCSFTLADILSKVKLLTSGHTIACFFKKKKKTTTTSTSTTTTSTTTLAPTTSTTTTTTTAAPTSSTTTTTTTTAPTTSSTTTSTTTGAGSTTTTTTTTTAPTTTTTTTTTAAPTTTTSTTTTTTTTLHTFNTFLTFDLDVQDSDQGVTGTVAEIDPDTEFQFDFINPTSGLPSTMNINIGGNLFMVVDYFSDYEGDPFRLIDDTGATYSGVFTNGTVNF